MNRKLRKLINENISALKGSSQDFAAVYDITFSHPELIMAEENNGFKIKQYTYGEIKKLCDETAGGILKGIGETHSFIALQMENSVSWIAAFWGILKSGNKPYLVNTRHPESMTADIFKSLGITTVICDKKGSLDVNYITFDEIEKSDICTAAFENELAIATSATSLKPTVCIYTGQNVSAQIFNTEGILLTSKRMAKHYKGALKNLAFLPFYHIFGLFAVYFWFTFFQRTIVFLKDLSPKTILHTVRLHEVTHIFAVPLLWHTVEKEILKEAEKSGRLNKLKKGINICTQLQNVFPFLGAALSKRIMSSVTDKVFGRSVQFTISGGSFINKSALELFNAVGYALHNGYGMSEIGISSVELANKPKDRNKGLIGKPLSSVSYRLTEQGVLEVKGASICDRIIVDGKQKSNGEWLCTGDIMEKDRLGNYKILGRTSDLFIGENGENINPDMLEAHFNLPDALEFSVLGLKGEKGEELSTVVRVNEYLPEERISALKNELLSINNTLPTPEQIGRFYITYDPLCAATAIKVSRSYLRREIENGRVRLFDFKREISGERKTSPIMDKVLGIIAKELDIAVEDIDPAANLMIELGASSLQYFSILQALAEEFHLTAEGEEYTYTANDFCRYIERHI